MNKVIHLIPYDGIGGVESAANTIKNFKIRNIDFEILYIFNNKSNKFLNFFNYFVKSYRLIKANPDLVIISLWRSCIVGIIFKILKPKTKLVLFLHYPHHYHFADMIFTNLMAKMCTSIWADSNDTLESRLPNFPEDRSDVISFVARRLKPVTNDLPKPNFIFWGRLHEQKSIHIALNIFARIKKQYSEASYTIIGPDGGEMIRLKRLSKKLSIEKNVNFLGPKDFDSIINLSKLASFYLQTSKLEGMAMSVVEAMQLGLVPLATPVGEIKNYCTDRVNAILISDEDRAAESILDLLDNKMTFKKIRKNTISYWNDSEIYSESIERASLRMLNIENVKRNINI
tara:strand:+ start:263 stop:1291 length:1029 start_codon:yes stop_codon:yes gene_type:complete